MYYDVVIVGTGRVGIPVLLAFANAGKKVAAVDKNVDILQFIKAQKMPFKESGCQEILEKHKIDCFTPEEQYPLAKYYILTVGTPLDQHIETDLSAVKAAVINLIEHRALHENATLILRSTVAPGTTQFVKDLLESRNVKCKLAMCPERLAEGKAWEEIHKLPQIIGGIDDESSDSAAELFSCLGVWTYKVSPIEAELAKLFCNIYRYINFSIPNYFLYLMNEFGVSDTSRLFEVMKDNYPRMQGLATPGLAAGTCVPGNRKIIVYTKGQKPDNIDVVMHKQVMPIEELYNAFNKDEAYFVASYDSTIHFRNNKQIKNVIKREYSGPMYKFTFENDKSFECTGDHLIPVRRQNMLILDKAENIWASDYVFLDNTVSFQIAKIESIDITDSANIDVFNIELESLEEADDLYYCDMESKLIHHNCLRKDFGMINECFPQTDLLLQAYKINEFMPKFLVDQAGDLKGKIVIVLGYTFKRDTDDTRDSLVPKLIRYVERQNPAKVIICEPNLPIGKVFDKFNNYELDNCDIHECVIAQSMCKDTVVFVGTNHSVFERNNDVAIMKGRASKFIDIWDIEV